jgi:3-hydroxyisobutyrate dehydrogenase
MRSNGEQEMAVTAKNVGFIGLGVMGMQMARHLAAAGYGLTVYDINQDALKRLQSLQPAVKIASSPGAVAAASEIVMTMLPTGREVHETVFGADGLLQGFKTGSLLLDTSSSEPWRTKAIAAGLAEAGVGMVDAPVSGAEAGAIEATLVFMVGGEAASVRRVEPLLSVLGRRVFYLGPVGAGHAMKSINNLITAVTFLATAEGLFIGKGYGLDPAVMNDVLNESTGMSWITQHHIARRILSRRFDDPFKFDLMVKDINIALTLAQDLQLELPLSIMAQALWQETQAGIPKGSSVSELVRALETKIGVELSGFAPR